MVSSNKTKSSSSVSNVDRRVAAQDSAIAISGDGDVVIDQTPEEFIELLDNSIMSANEIATRSLDQVAAAQANVKEIAANTQPVDGKINPTLLAAAAVAALWVVNRS